MPEFSRYSLAHFPLLLCQIRIFCKFTALFDVAVHIIKTRDISQLFCDWAVDWGLCSLLAGLEKQECNDSYQRFGKRIGKQLPVSPNFGCNATRMQGIHCYPGTWEEKLTLWDTRVTKIKFLLTSSIQNQEKKLWETIKW